MKPDQDRRKTYRRAEDLYRKAVEDIEDYAIFTTDAHGLVTSWNFGATRILGYEESEILGTSASKIFTPEDLQQGEFEKEMSTALRNGCAEDERFHLRKSGARFWASGVLTPFYNQSGEFFGFSKVMRDMTEKRRLEEERDRFFTMSVDMLCIVNFDGSFNRVNPACYSLLGYSKEELMSLKIFDLLHPDDREATESEYKNLSIGNPTNYMENRLRCKDGSYKWVAWSYFPDLENKLAYGVGRDTTELKRLWEILNLRAEELEQANRVKDEFLATLSHELRTPLSSILGWARLLQTGALGRTEQERAIEIIQRNSVAQTRLIEDLLDVSRIISGKLRFELATISFPDIAEIVINGMKPSIEAKHLKLRVSIDPAAGPIQGDPTRLQQIVTNILSNAIKFTPENGVIEVELKRSGDKAQLKISDTGIGIATETLPHIFERFTQADSSNIRSHAGLGLGLAIVDYLVRQQGGQVTAHSEGTGRGATFTVEFPIAPSDVGITSPGIFPQPVQEENRFKFTGSLENLRVLVVEDDPDTQNLIRTILEGAGAFVVAVGSVSNAFEEIQKAVPDVIVSDIGMPAESGFDLIHRIRSLMPDERGRIPAIALTAYAGHTDRRRALRAGFQTHLAKPVSPDELIAAVANLTGSNADRV